MMNGNGLRSITYLDGHADADKGHDPFGVVHIPQPAKPRCATAVTLLVASKIRMGELLLEFGDVEEVAVGSLEQGNA